MEPTTESKLSEILAREAWTAEDHKELLRALFEVNDAPGKFRAMLAQLRAENPDARGGAALKIGIGLYMLCRFDEALESLAAATDNRDRRYFQGLCCKNLRRYDAAAEEFERARARGWGDAEIDLQLAELKALSGDPAAAEKALKRLEKELGGTADFAYVRGLAAELDGRGEEAAEHYGRARAAEPGHAGATFRLAYYYDLHGDEDQAVELYRQCISRPPIHANALLNLAVLYEDAGRYNLAIACLRRILATNPSHARARLFLKDAQASRTMYYDEDRAKRLAWRNAVLDIPVTDFELSVRARNCLKKMNIRTLGDLVRTSETDLLSYKNFGETSLKEIRDMLAAKGLRLGQALEEGSEFSDLRPRTPAQVDNEGILATPASALELSIRSRRALESLRVMTLGELAAKTESELLACKNFGQTSLNEIRQRLAEYGLNLREPT